MPEGVEIRTTDRDLGFAIALWISDLLEDFCRTHRSATVVIDDDGLVGRPLRNGVLQQRDHFRATHDGGVIRLHCSTSAVVLPSRAAAGVARKALVRLRLANDAVPLDHRRVILQQRRVRQVARAALKLTERTQPCRFLLRVDDFPSPAANLDAFAEFHQIAFEHGLPYLLAVTPFLESKGEPTPLSDAAIQMLHRIRSEGVELALHGFSHKSRYRNYGTELFSLPATLLRAELARADEYLSSHGLDTVAFVAPFNSYDPLTFSVLAERFRLICGGPESVSSLGYRVGPSFLLQRLYVPSYRDAYDLNLRRLPRFDRLVAAASGLTIPVTLHWANEVRDGFRGFRALCARLKDRTQRWGDFIASAEAVKSRYGAA